MSTAKADVKQYYPLPVYNYKVHLGEVTMAFTEVSGLSVSHQTETYRDGLSYKRGYSIIRGFSEPIKLTLKKGIYHAGSSQHTNVKKLWLDGFLKNKLQHITVELCDEEGIGLMYWKVFHAVPVKLDPPTFDASSNAIAVETMEFTGNGISIHYNAYTP